MISESGVDLDAIYIRRCRPSRIPAYYLTELWMQDSFPKGATVLGRIFRARHGDGVLMRMPNGELVDGANGIAFNLPQKEAEEALRHPTPSPLWH